MPNMISITQGDCALEFTPEAGEKMCDTAMQQEGIPIESLEGLAYRDVSKLPYFEWKHIWDVILAILVLLVLAVPMLCLALLVFIDEPGNVIFTQYRVGRNGQLFKLYKFRTMKAKTPKYMATNEMHNPGKYITKVGRVLRKLSLDELPQLFNVLKGDMSLVGPRPLIPSEQEIHTMRSRYGVYTARPGVTGLAQINGRDLVSPAEKVRWDVKYLERFGLMQDLRILIRTVPKVFGCSDVVEGGNPVTPRKE